MKAKRTFKDSLFRHIFNDKQRLASLYAALTGRHITPKEITITTLRGVFFNDISFRIGGRDIILMEHQSSWNPNMPLHMLWYIAKLYNRQIDSQEVIYRSRIIKIPAPEFYVFYNGAQEEPEHQKLHLQDAFSHPTDTLDLVVDCYNINYLPTASSWHPATNCAATAYSYRKSATASARGSSSKPQSGRPSPTVKPTTS